MVTLKSNLDLIGREELIAQATAWLRSKPSGGRVAGVLLVGRPGAGTSTVALAVAERLRAGQGNGPDAVVLHDVHRRPDNETFAVLVGATEQGRVVISTAREGATLPASIARRWSEGSILRLDVRPLDTAGVAALVGSMLGGKAALNLASPLATATEGLPLYLREIIAEVADRNEARLVDGVWVRSASRLTPGPRLVALVHQRLALSDEPCRKAIELLAVAGALPVHTARQLISADDLECAESTGLVELTKDHQLQVTPPILGEAIERSLSVVGRLRHRQLLLERGPELDLPDALTIRMGRWLLEDNDHSRDPLLVRASELAAASGDFEASGNFARAALEASERAKRGSELALDIEHRARARLVAARAMRFDQTPQQSIRAAEPLLAPGPEGDALIGAVSARVRAALLVADVQHYTLGQYDQSMRTLAELRSTTDGLARRQVDIETLVHQAFAGNLAEVLPELEKVEQDPTSTAAERAMIAGSLIMALHEAGRGDEAIRLGERSLQLAMMSAAENPVVVSEIASAWTMARVWTVGTTDLDNLLINHDANPSTHLYRYDDGVNQLGVGMLLLERGASAAALDELLGAISVFRVSDPSGFMASTLAAAVHAAACCDRSALAEQLAERWFDTPAGASGIIAAEMGRNMLWYRYVRGGPAEVADVAWPQVRRHEENGMWASSVRTRHTMLRLGVPSEISDLEPLVRRVRGGYVEAMLEHLRGVADSDGERLLVTSEALERVGALLISAECAAQAAELLRVHGKPSAARRAAARVRDLVAELGPTTTPILGGWSAPVELTEREQQVAALVSEQLSSAEVGERLGISGRTVEAHLQRIYDKLGVNKRTELAAVLAGRE